MNYTQLFQNCQTVGSALKLRDELLNSGRALEIKQLLATSDKTQKSQLGKELNDLKTSILESSNIRITEIQEIQNQDNFLEFDPTFFSYKKINHQGNLHPITILTKQIVEIFEKMGFEVADGPLVETQEYCFTLLNMPDYHPARGMQDTFYLEQKDQQNENYLLRTHTSSVQIRYGKTHKPPFKIISPGQVFRNENIDATHDVMFHQVECLIVDKKITLSHLKTLIQDFYDQFFTTSGLKIRFRTSYFPYTIPSLEVDISNPFKGKVGHKLANQEWIEAGGAGLVHPDVLKNMGIDPNEWQGLAFGFGIDRMVQIQLGISGLGQFFNGNLEFLAGKEI